MGRLSDISVLFADCRGFTQLIHECGSEEITPYIDEFFRRCSAIVVRHDGILDNFRGDAVLAFFNVPIRRDDHIQRAVEAAMEIQLAVPEINVGRGKGDLLKVGIGVTSSLAMTASVGSNACRDSTVIGDTVNIASRLQGLAEPGEILASEVVYEAVGKAFPGASKRVLELKGLPEPVRAYVLNERGLPV